MSKKVSQWTIINFKLIKPYNPPAYSCGLLSSAQSISSFFAATPSRDYAYALLQNFRNKICLSTEDPITIEYISQLTGKAKTMKKTSSYNNETISEVRDSVLEAQIFRSLPAEHAISLLSINNKSRDDAIKLFPIYTDNSSNIANG